MIKFIITIYLLAMVTAWSDIQIAVADLQNTSGTTLVKIDVKNTFDQSIHEARAWVFLLDQNGKVVGQKAQWILGHPRQNDTSGATHATNTLMLEPDKLQQISVAVPHSVNPNGVPKSAKVTFSRIILDDGKVVNPQDSVKQLVKQ